MLRRSNIKNRIIRAGPYKDIKSYFTNRDIEVNTMTRTTTIDTHDAQNVKISKTTHDEYESRDTTITVTVESENDTTIMTVYGDKDLNLEVTE